MFMFKKFHMTNKVIVAAAETVLLLFLSVFLPSALSFLIKAIFGLYLAMAPAAIVIAALYVRKHKNGKVLVDLFRDTMLRQREQVVSCLKEVTIPLWGIGVLIAVGAFFPQLLRCMILSGIILTATVAPFAVVAVFRASIDVQPEKPDGEMLNS